jgi:hypothetical protein
MMTRSMLLIGLVASIILPLDGPRSIAQTAPTLSRILLQEKSLSMDITYFAVREQLNNTWTRAVMDVDILHPVRVGLSTS